ncbi:condensin-2 complex subunit G2 [Clupea harengus]|uniref:Condensin-2 complex subunit G2 n=1 Tax=Clupea harengus TaxID=7950 RepID=A0A6P8GMZ3_CLUHA|nr:condensin-2 complex subunit G2 [Clupea harengus]XP_031440183.1 condensin-2 complex subunit G2 [Clupea harengus]
MSKREAFINSVCISKTEDFFTFITLHKDASEPFDLRELLQELQKAQRQALWKKLAKLLQDAVVACPAERWNATDVEQDEQGMELEVPLELKQTMQVIQGVTEVATACVETIEEGDTYTSLLDCANILNDLLSFLPQSEAALQKSVHELFGCWWIKGLHGKEELGLTVLLTCLRKPVPDMKRLWVFHEALLSVPLDSELGQELANQLLLCFLNANHIRRDEGKRFLVFLFSWDLVFIRMIHKTVKNQLQFFRKAEMEHLAEIYFRAWKKASGTFLEEIESNCIQEFMQHGIQLHRNSPVLPKVRQILSYFHKQKFRQGLDEMLHRLYRPILWRALKAANGEVRANATLLFTEAFPLKDPSMDVAATDESLQRQLDTLFYLLDDQQPLVRSTAVLGTCTVLSKCWEFIPSDIIGDLLKKMVQQLAYDASSPDVRCSVFMCMSIILDNNLTHAVLENLLPLLRTSLHDTSEKVRVAFVDMLIKIKAVRATKFWKVSSMEHLLARLERDSPSVSKRIVNLLFSSFFPVNQSELVWCERCVTLIQMSPKAARKFYQYAHLYTAPNNLGKLMLIIRKCLNSCIKKAQDQDPDDTTSANKENLSELEDVLSVKDTDTMARLLEIVVILWRSIQKSLLRNKDVMDYLVAKFATVLPEYLRFFQDDHACTVALLCMASLLPAASVPSFSCGVLSRLRKLEVGASVSHYSQILDCLCSWGQASHILELISDWLTEALAKAAAKDDSARRVRIQETMEAKPDLGLDFLDYLLNHPPTRDAVLNVALGKLKQLLKALSSCKSELYSCVSAFEPPARARTTETAMKAFSLHSRLLVHLQSKSPEDRDRLQDLELSAAWVTERILPFLVAPAEDVISTQQVKLAQRVVETCLTVLRDVIIVGQGDMEFTSKVLDLCSVVLLSERGYLCIPAILSVLSSLGKDCMSQGAPGQEEQVPVVIGVLTNIFHKILEVMALKLRKDREEGTQVCLSSRTALMDFLSVAQELASVHPEGHDGVFSSLFAAIVVEISHALHKVSHVEQLSTPETTEDLPPLSSHILEILLKCPPAVTRSLFAMTQQSLDADEIESLAGLAAVTHLLAVVKPTGKFKADLKSIAVSVQRQMERHCAGTGESEEEIQKLLYISSVRTVNEILMP